MPCRPMDCNAQTRSNAIIHKSLKMANSADCKSAGLRLQRFESFPAHFLLGERAYAQDMLTPGVPRNTLPGRSPAESKRTSGCYTVAFHVPTGVYQEERDRQRPASLTVFNGSAFKIPMGCHTAGPTHLTREGETWKESPLHRPPALTASPLQAARLPNPNWVKCDSPGQPIISERILLTALPPPLPRREIFWIQAPVAHATG